jgi:mitochondrial enoyl-[acyl-carrier protein] reductase / trans-2-enoyl-CoA reductase
MSKTFKAAVYETHGNPAEVLRVIESPLADPGPDEVVVKMSAAPINPADLNSIEGKYPIKAPLPATPGMEGAGTVIEVGSAVRDLEVGRR